MKNCKRFNRILSLILAIVMVVSMIPAPLAQAAEAGTQVYLKPNENWLQGSARFAVYFWNDSGSAWLDVTDTDGDGYFEVTLPAGYSSLIFCRMNPDAKENNWDNRWNKTGDLTIPADGSNCFTVPEGSWDGAAEGWSTYAPVPSVKYIVAGDAALCGTNWDPTDAANQMSDEDGDGIYTIVYPNVAAGTYNLKVTDGSWANSWGNNGSNYTFVVSDVCDVTVSFDSNAKTVAVTGEHIGQPAGLEITAMYAVGNGSGAWLNGAGWDPANGANRMAEISDKVYELTLEKVPAGSAYEFKFAANGDWTHSWGTDGTDLVVGESNTAAYNGQNIKLTVPYELADVTLKLDLTGYDHSTKTGAAYTVTLAEVEAEPVVDYYLYGYINGADVTANEESFKFANGKLSTSFTADSYVFIKDSNGKQYMAPTYTEAASTALTADGGEKMKVPAGVDLEFILTVNDDGTLTLSYHTITDTVTIHFAKPADWADPINAYLWMDGDVPVPGYEDYKSWPGKPVSYNAETGFYDLVVAHEGTTNFNFIFNDGSNQTDDLTTGQITGSRELWVLNGEVLTEKPQYTANLHFQKGAEWADTIFAWIWDEAGKLPGYEDYNTTWPGVAVAADPYNDGWYNVSVTTAKESGFSFIFSDGNGKQTTDLATGTLNYTTDLWIVGGAVQTEAPEGWFDAGRKVYIPGTFPGKNWDASSNEMTYDPQLGLYVYTFENVPAGSYEFKIAINGSWSENYGAAGVPGGGNMSVTVPRDQDVTVWYNDETHYSITSVTYDVYADITLSGTGIPENTKLTDMGLTGLFSAALPMTAGTYADLSVAYSGKTVEFNEFTLSADKTVTFYFDITTGMAYHDGSDVKVDAGAIYFNTKDTACKAPFGAVATGEDVTFGIDTGADVIDVRLVVKGLEPVAMEQDGEAVDGVQHWTCTTAFPAMGEYQYYFAVSNGSDLTFYCDDNYNNYYRKGDYGTGTTRDLANLFPYDLVVYEAGYETPDWMKNAVIYQIFPDRFFDGDETNNRAQTWARGTVDYEYIADWYTLPENPEQVNNPGYPENAHRGDGEWSNEIYGGDLKGITQRIDYLKALGVNVIYLNPVFWSISNHRYDAVDYTQIDPILGTLGDFEELVAVAEANGMHIILDGVFNHVSDDSVYFDRYYKFLPDAAEKHDGKIGAYPYWAYVYDYMAENEATQADAEAAARAHFGTEYGITDYSYTEWFAVSSAPMEDGTVVDTIGLRAGKPVYTYEGWWGYDSMPIIYSTNGSEYQTGNWAQEIISGSNSVNAYWIGKGMDGWRLDVANEVSDETWQNFRDSVKALNSDAVIIGEIWADSTRYLMGDMYDSVMNYVFRDAVAGFARGYLINRDNKEEKYDADLTADEAMTILEILRERYPEEAFYAMMNLVGSHDTARILSYLDDVEDDRFQKEMEYAFPTYETTSDRAKQLQYIVSFLQFTYAGAPTIYYGDEIGMVGGDDPDDRRAFEWGVAAEGKQELVEWYAALAAIREQYPALRTGTVEPFSTGNDDVMGFVRRDANDTLIVLANRAPTAATVKLDAAALDVTGKSFTDLITGKALALAEITVDAYRGAILTTNAKSHSVNTAALAPAYDPAYLVPARDPNGHQHAFGDWTVTTEPTCTEAGEEVRTCHCGETEVREIPALGHDEVAHGAQAPTCTETGWNAYVTCSRCDYTTYVELPALGHTEEEIPAVAPSCTETGLTAGVKCSVCGEILVEQTVADALGHNYVDGVCTNCGDVLLTRISGESACETALKIADTLKETLDVEAFETIVVAAEGSDANILSGSYLASVSNAPILLTYKFMHSEVIRYVRKNMVQGGTVYILGNYSDVSIFLDISLRHMGIQVKRLSGKNAEEVNLAVLKEVGIPADKDLLICSSKKLEEALSAAATGMPILLVSNKVTREQLALVEAHTGDTFLIGDNSVINKPAAKQLGNPQRISGKTAYDTSQAIAEKYFPDAEAAVLAPSADVTLGLTGSTLAYAMKAPLLLADSKNTKAADSFVDSFTKGYVLGKASRISDKAARDIFDLSATAFIAVK